MTEHDSKVIEKIQADFSAFKVDIQHQLERMQTAIEKKQTAGFLKLGSVLVSTIVVTLSSLAFIFAYIFDYKLNITNDYNQSRFERLEHIVTFSSKTNSNPAKKLQQKGESIQRTPIRKKAVKPKRKINNEAVLTSDTEKQE